MNMETSKAAQTVNALAGLYERPETPDAAQRTAAYWWGAQDEEVPWWLGLCKMVNTPEAQSLYIASVAEDLRHARGLKEWAYRVAVEYAGSRGSGQRRRSIVEAYRPEWGHQAARDGLAMALWPDLRGEIPGRDARCEQFGCGHTPYQRIRDEVMRAAGDLITGFAMDMEQCRTGRFSRDFTGRWEVVSGRDWSTSVGLSDSGDYYPAFAPGCSRTKPAPSLDDYDGVSDR